MDHAEELDALAPLRPDLDSEAADPLSDVVSLRRVESVHAVMLPMQRSLPVEEPGAPAAQVKPAVELRFVPFVPRAPRPGLRTMSDLGAGSAGVGVARSGKVAKEP